MLGNGDLFLYEQEECGMIWYIEKSGEAKEIPEEVLKYKIENNEISGDTLAVNEEIKNWVPLKETALWKEYNSEGSGNSAADFDLNSASHQWRCPKCGNMINKDPCPYCAQGEPTQTTSSSVHINNATKQSAAKPWITFFVLFFAVMAGIFLLVDTFGGKVSDSDYISSAETVIAEQLKNPSTATFNEAKVIEKDAYGRAIVYIDVSAQNGFGGWVRDEYYVCIQSVKKDGTFTYKSYFNSVNDAMLYDTLKSANDFGVAPE